MFFQYLFPYVTNTYMKVFIGLRIGLSIIQIIILCVDDFSLWLLVCTFLDISNQIMEFRQLREKHNEQLKRMNELNELNQELERLNEVYAALTEHRQNVQRRTPINRPSRVPCYNRSGFVNRPRLRMRH